MTLRSFPFEQSAVTDLVMAILAVNQWRLDQSSEIYDGLLREGLFDPEKIQQMSDEDVFRALTSAGYKKSAYVKGLICDRLKDLAEKLSGSKRDYFHNLIHTGHSDELKAFVMDIKGVGPMVYENFCLLQKGARVQK